MFFFYFKIRFYSSVKTLVSVQILDIAYSVKVKVYHTKVRKFKLFTHMIGDLIALLIIYHNNKIFLSIYVF